MAPLVDPAPLTYLEFFELALKLAKQNRQASIALRGDILLMVDGETVLVRNTR